MDIYNVRLKDIDKSDVAWTVRQDALYWESGQRGINISPLAEHH